MYASWDGLFTLRSWTCSILCVCVCLQMTCSHFFLGLAFSVCAWEWPVHTSVWDSRSLYVPGNGLFTPRFGTPVLCMCLGMACSHLVLGLASSVCAWEWPVHTSFWDSRPLHVPGNGLFTPRFGTRVLCMCLGTVDVRQFTLRFWTCAVCICLGMAYSHVVLELANLSTYALGWPIRTSSLDLRCLSLSWDGLFTLRALT